MSGRSLIIEVGQREAIPVRAIPYITGWRMSPDEVALQLSGDAGKAINVLGEITAYRLSAGIAIEVMPKEWDSILASIYLLQHQLKTQYPQDESDYGGPDFGYAAWREQSPFKLPNDVFVWKDEFEPAFFNAYNLKNVTIINERPGERRLTYSPLLPAGVTIDALLEGFNINTRRVEKARADEHENRKAVSANTSHRLASRRHPLDHIITMAKNASSDPGNHFSVWAELIRLAQTVSPPAPVIEYVEGEGIKFQTNKGEIKIFSDVALRKKMSRMPAKAQ